MTKISLLVVLLSLNAFSNELCKQTIVKFNTMFGKIITADDFSSMTFDETKLTQAQFNALSSKEQVEIFEKIKPLDHKSRETLKSVSYVKEDVMDTMRMISILGVPEGMSYEDLNSILKMYEDLEALEVELLMCV